MVAAAIVGSAVVGAAGTAIAGSSAANATQNATNATLSQTAQLSAPYRALGEAAIPQYEALLGITPPSSQPTIGSAFAGGNIPGLPGDIRIPNQVGGGAAPPTPSIEQALAATPGYQFTKSQGEQGIVNQASLGGGISGNTLAALDTFNTGLADQTYQQAVGNIANAVGSGQAAAAGQAQTVSSVLPGEGQTLAGIDANTAAGITKAIGNASNQYQTMQALNALNNQVPVTPDTISV